ncbi:polysaccharide biosynthesis/export family protein [Paraburkholderia solisilvae]
MNHIGHATSVPASAPVDATPNEPRHASRVLRALGLGGALSLLLVLGACGADPGQHYSIMDQDRYGTSVTGVPGAQRTVPPGAADDDRPPPGALTEITPELIKAERLAEPTHLPQDVESLFAAPTPYEIGAGDVLSIQVWDHPELNLLTTNVQTVGIDFTGSASVSTGYTVDSNGLIQFAYAGAVHVGGLTEMQARNVLSAELGKYVRNPQVTLRVQSYRSKRVYMDGEVHSPGLQIFNDVPMTLTEALNRAGGFTPVGDRANIAVIRNGKSVIVNIPEMVSMGINPSNVMLRNNDMVRVFAREDSKVFMIGELSHPTTLFLRNGELSLNEALGDAGGVNQQSGNSQVYVVRNITADTHQVFHLDASNPSALALAEGFELKAKDVVFVDTASVVRWSRFIDNVVPTAQAAYLSRTAYGSN